MRFFTSRFSVSLLGFRKGSDGCLRAPKPISECVIRRSYYSNVAGTDLSHISDGYPLHPRDNTMSPLPQGRLEKRFQFGKEHPAAAFRGQVVIAVGALHEAIGLVGVA